MVSLDDIPLFEVYSKLCDIYLAEFLSSFRTLCAKTLAAEMRFF